MTQKETGGILREKCASVEPQLKGGCHFLPFADYHILNVLLTLKDVKQVFYKTTNVIPRE